MNAKKVCMNCMSELGEFVCSRCSLVVGEKCFNKEDKICVLCEGGMIL